MGDNVTTVAPGGRTLPRTAEDAAALGATVQDPAIGEAEAVVQRQRKMFERPIDKALAFTEGVIDAATLGLVHGHDADSAMNRDVNSGYNFAGEAVGTALGLVTGGPVRGVAGLGERAGVAAAKGVLRQGEKAIVTTALREAGAGAALTGATAFGHQLIDAVIEDRAFSGEAVLDATKLGGIIGLAGGGLMGGFGKLATRADVKLQGGLVGDLGDALGTHESASAAYGEALHFHEQQLGALKQLRKAGALGDVSDDFLRVRSATIKEARAAQQALRDLDVEAALSGKDPAAYKNFQRRWSEYTRAMEQVDEIMTPHPAELVGARRLGAEAGPAGETSVSQTSSATPADMAGTQVRSVRGSEDFIVPASRVSEAIPDEAGYLANYKSRPMESVEGAPAQMPEGTPAGTVPGKKTAMPPPNDLALLDEAIKKLPMRTGEENGAVFASALDGPTQLESVPYGQVAKQMDAADAAAATAVRPGPIEKPMPADVTNRLMDSWV